MKKKLTATLCAAMLLTLCLMMGVCAARGETYTYTDEALGFTLTLPKEHEASITIETVDEDTVGFYFTPAYGTQWDGRLFQIDKYQPIAAYRADSVDEERFAVIAFGEDCIYACSPPGGGTHFAPEDEAAYLAIAETLSLDYLRVNLIPDRPGVWPRVDLEATVTELDDTRPGDGLTRGEVALLLYGLLEADNKGERFEASFTDLTEGDDCYAAAAYLEHYAVLAGYPDGTFRPEGTVTRAELVVLLHRIQFWPVNGWYGDGMDFSDVVMELGSHWAIAYLNSAWEEGWIQGYPDGAFRPNATVTRQEGARIINRMLGHETLEDTDGLLFHYAGERVAFDYPAQWAVARERHEDGSYLSLTMPGGQLHFAFWEAWMVDLERTAAGFVEFYSGYEDVTVLDRAEIDLDGHDGLKWVYTYTEDGELRHVVLYETVCGYIAIQLFYNCPEGTESTNLEQVEALVASLDIIEPA